MKAKALTIFTLAGALAVGLSSSTMAYAAQTAAVSADNDAIKDRVDDAIDADATLKDQNIHIAVANGVVTLTGAVQTTGRKTHAAQVAKVAGVTRVDNQLRVDAKDGKSMVAKTEDATKTVAKKTEQGAVKVGEETKDVATATADNVTDAYITTSLHAKFLDETSLKGSDINVDTNNHVVTLKGTVASAAGKARAEEIARTTKGVNRVMNQLSVGPKK